MAERFKVVGLWVVHKRQRYVEGDLLPEEFTERDRVRNIYSRRIQKVEIEDVVNDQTQSDTITTQVTTPTPPIVNIPPQVPTTVAEVKPSVVKPTGTSTSTVKISPSKTAVGK